MPLAYGINEFKGVLDDKYDDLTEQSFNLVGNMNNFSKNLQFKTQLTYEGTTVLLRCALCTIEKLMQYKVDALLALKELVYRT